MNVFKMKARKFYILKVHVKDIETDIFCLGYRTTDGDVFIHSGVGTVKPLDTRRCTVIDFRDLPKW